MIFVTVGSTFFDKLVKQVDTIAADLKEEVVVQIGNGKFIPKNCEYFKYAPSLIPYFKKADLVIAQGGAAACFEVLGLGKKLICVDNPDVNDNHQPDLLRELQSNNYILWCKDMRKLAQYVKNAQTHKFSPYKSPQCLIGKKIEEFLVRL